MKNSNINYQCEDCGCADFDFIIGNRMPVLITKDRFCIPDNDAPQNHIREIHCCACGRTAPEWHFKSFASEWFNQKSI
jgi:hypothetical protein